MERYYDLVMANTMKRYLKEDAGVSLPGTEFDHLPPNERWKKVKETFYGGRLGVISEWGLIDFDPAEKEKLVGGEEISYDEFLNLQKKSGHSVRVDFTKTYYDAAFASFNGKIDRINVKKNKCCFERIFISGMYPDGNGFFGKEDHVWMELDGFEEYRVGDCLAFDAEVYRYVKTGKGKMIDFGLRFPENIRKIGEYDLPSAEELQLQAVDDIICGELCLFTEHCDRFFCIANPEWREMMRNALRGSLR